jgi:RNA polymerase subunit RPABC4/transcription elongation factor Spt4
MFFRNILTKMGGGLMPSGLSFLVLVILILVPNITFGASLVPCGIDRPCEFCDVVTLLSNVINFIILDVGAPLATIVLAWGGMILIVNGNNPGERARAKKMMVNVGIGFILVIFAWAIVSTVINLIINKGKIGAWNKIECVGINEPNLQLDLSRLVNGGASLSSTNSSQNGIATGNESMNRKIIDDAGISINRTNPCGVNETSGCTSVGGFKQNTLNYLVSVKSDICPSCSKSDIVLTGGSECHGTSCEGHGTGDKFDLSYNSTTLNSAITNSSRFTKINTLRSDGAVGYLDTKTQNIFWDEPAKANNPRHWDVQVKS